MKSKIAEVQAQITTIWLVGLLSLIGFLTGSYVCLSQSSKILAALSLFLFGTVFLALFVFALIAHKEANRNIRRIDAENIALRQERISDHQVLKAWVIIMKDLCYKDREVMKTVEYFESLATDASLPQEIIDKLAVIAVNVRKQLGHKFKKVA